MTNSDLANKIDALARSLKALEGEVRHLDYETTQIKDSLGKAKAETPQTKITGKSLILLAKTKFVWGVSFVISLLALVTGYIQLRYDVSVSYLTSLNPAAPFQSRFLVTNNGPFSIYGVTYFCASAHVHINNGIEIRNATIERDGIGELNPRGSYSVRCLHPVGDAHIDSGAFMEIHILYTPKFTPWRHIEGGQQFVLKYDDRGNAVWLPVAAFTKTVADMEKETANP